MPACPIPRGRPPARGHPRGRPTPAPAHRERVAGGRQATFPEVIERVRPGWHLIGYDLPVEGRRKPVYFAYVGAEAIHVHLGFEHGWAMRDPRGLLQGVGITKQVRWLTFEPGDRSTARRVPSWSAKRRRSH